MSVFLDLEEDALRRARAREAYEKMYPLSTDDPYGEKRLEQVQTPAGVTRVFNQVAREMGLGACVDAQDSEEIRRLEPREIDRNAYRQPIARERCPRESRARRRPGWVTIRFVSSAPDRRSSDRQNHEIILSRDPGVEHLSVFELELIAELFGQFEKADQWAISEWCHEHCGEWLPLDKGTEPISLAELALEVGQQVEEVLENATERNFLAEVFG